MTPETLSRPDSVDTLFWGFALALELFARCVRKEPVLPAQWQPVSQILEALPLPTSDFSLARKRLGNARIYSDECERDAASFELKLLQRQADLWIAGLSGHAIGRTKSSKIRWRA